MADSLGRFLLFTVGGLILGSVVGPIVGYLGQIGLLRVNIYAGIGFAAIVGAIGIGLMGLFSSGLGGLVTGALIGAALGGLVDYFFHPAVNIFSGWFVGAGLGLVGGLVAGWLAPAESQVGPR